MCGDLGRQAVQQAKLAGLVGYVTLASETSPVTERAKPTHQIAYVGLARDSAVLWLTGLKAAAN